MFVALTSPQLNQVKTAIAHKKLNPTPPSFEVSPTPLANSPFWSTISIEIS
jgi:hypothetical protein